VKRERGDIVKRIASTSTRRPSRWSWSLKREIIAGVVLGRGLNLLREGAHRCVHPELVLEYSRSTGAHAQDEVFLVDDTPGVAAAERDHGHVCSCLIRAIVRPVTTDETG